MKPEGSLPHSQVPNTCPYSESDQSSPRPTILRPEDPSSYYPPIYTWVFKLVSFPQVFPPKSVNNFPLSHTCHMPHPSHWSRFYHPHNTGWVQINTTTRNWKRTAAISYVWVATLKQRQYRLWRSRTELTKAFRKQNQPNTAKLFCDTMRGEQLAS